ncbi:TetR/AcrR family transcriptional regulator [Alteromonas oceanisediminis]|uniref:TetR/AcrR family transcriptional regulator n=1 Tax=Alteromonas oceanisediminis TaxID=2836180 RepID=UPI001BD98B8B|nr:TetR/AcrR family transcriptional regulator [Alteromonas oceanisediminis]MBT0587358.1 TetR/AcrR family transcriptional regulator [Alteromonas oceanisediminis]
MDVRISRSKQLIVKAGLELFLKNADATLVDIAKHANVGRATVYRHFESREILQKEIAFYCLKQFDRVNKDVGQQAKDHLDALRLILKNTMPLFAEFSFLSKMEQLLIDEGDFQSHFEQQNDEMRELINSLIINKKISNNFSATWVCDLFEGLLWVGHRAIERGEHNPESAADLAYATFLNGVRAGA